MIMVLKTLSLVTVAIDLAEPIKGTINLHEIQVYLITTHSEEYLDSFLSLDIDMF